MSEKEQSPKEKPMAEPGLYLISTPIGNLGDITLRSLKALEGAAEIYCEDTRVTAKLLNHYGIAKKTLPYHEHNAHKVRPALIKKLTSGLPIALVSDAGTPMVNDPGYKLVQDCIEHQIQIHALPGASATLPALQLSGLPSNAFMFVGFFPVKDKARRDKLEELRDIRATFLAFETAPRLLKTLIAMSEIYPKAQVSVSRELTKKFEETRRGSATELVEHYDMAGPPKGEIVMVFTTGSDEPEEASTETIDAFLTNALTSMSVKDASKETATKFGMQKKQAYERALALKGKS
jgi:16S rRNA (cytidine1402-2'-O)-methyltransferase